MKYVHDGTATYLNTGEQHISRHWQSTTGAKEHAAQELKDILVQRGIIQNGDEVNIVNGGGTIILGIGSFTVDQCFQFPN